MPGTVTNFLYSLAKVLCTQASLTFVPAPTASSKTPLFVGVADERYGTDPMSVLADYTAPGQAFVQAQKISVQLSTVGRNRDAVRNRAWAIFAGFLAGNQPMRETTIAGIAADGSDDGHWHIIGADPVQSGPGFLSNAADDGGRWQATFNVDIEFYRMAS